MKKLVLIILLSLPVFVMAQENLIGKTRTQVAAYFKKAGIPLSSSEKSNGVITDQYKSSKHPDISCFFDKANICRKELAILAFADLATIKANLTRDWVKQSDEVWANKAKTVKVHITAVQPLDQLYLIYAAYDKDFGSAM